MLTSPWNVGVTARHERPPRQRKSAANLIVSSVLGSILCAGFLVSLQAGIANSDSDQSKNQRLRPVPKGSSAKPGLSIARGGFLERTTVQPVQSDEISQGLAPVAKIQVAASVPANVGEAAPAAALPEAANSPADGNREDKSLEEARALAEQWAQAWSNRDIDQYLGFYGKEFSPEGNLSRSTWEQSRRQKISGRKRISVSVHDLRLDPEGDSRLRLHFVQDYEADNFKEIGTRKQLILGRQDGSWRIVGEKTGGM